MLVERDIKVRYKQTVLGGAWAVLQPTMSVAVFFLVFGKLAKLPSDDVPYPVFAFCGMLPWMLFSTSVTSGGQSLVNQQHILTKVYMPRMLIPASCIGSAIVDMLIGAAVFLALMAWYGLLPGPGILALPLLVLGCVITSLGVSLGLAAMTVRYRDMRFVIPFLTQIWMYASPVVYSASIVPEDYRLIAAVNPMFGIISGFRSAFLGSPWMAAEIAVSMASGIVLLGLGVVYFRHTEKIFADVA